MSEAMERLRGFLIGGAVLYLLGGVGTVAAWPHTEAGLFGAERHGSMWLAAACSMAAFAGALLLLVAVVGLGVKYGREAADVD